MTFEKLRQEGWYVDSLKLENLLADDYDEKMSVQGLKNILIDQDIREWGDVTIGKQKDEKSFNGPVVVQLNKWRNINKPKMSDHMENDGICLLTFIDGAGGTIKAIQEETQRFDNINGNTPAGSKILLTGSIIIERDFLMLTKKNCKFLGGDVEKLVEKWKAERFSGKTIRKMDENVPRWVAFGKRKGTGTTHVDTQNFKAMAAINPTKEKVKEEAESLSQFDEARKAAIETIQKEKAVKKIETEQEHRKPNKPLINLEKREDIPQKYQKENDISKGGQKTDKPSSSRDDSSQYESGFREKIEKERNLKSTSRNRAYETTPKNSRLTQRAGRERGTGEVDPDRPTYAKGRNTAYTKHEGTPRNNTRGKSRNYTQLPRHYMNDAQRAGESDPDRSTYAKGRNMAYIKHEGTPRNNTRGRGRNYTQIPRHYMDDAQQPQRSDRYNAPREFTNSRYMRLRDKKRQQASTFGDFLPDYPSFYPKRREDRDYQHRDPRSSGEPSRGGDRNKNFQRDQRDRDPQRNRKNLHESQASSNSQVSRTPLPLTLEAHTPLPQPKLVPLGIENVQNGAYVLAPWYDSKLYPAVVISMGPADLCTVKYMQYGNTSMVPKGTLLLADYTQTA